MSARGLSSLQIAERNGAHWGSNDPFAWMSDFAPSATIVHPFFREAVTPKVAVEVMNATVCGSTVFDGCRVLSGDGDGREDLVSMHFLETGECAGYQPQYIGRMVVLAKIRDGLIAGLKVKGYDLLHAHPNWLRPFTDKPERNSLLDLTPLIAETWASNDMSRFCALFAPQAQIVHPLFSAPITPHIAADVLNSAMRGQSVARAPRLLLGNGDGQLDVAEMAFEETGDQIGYVPETMGVMHSSCRIVDGQIQEMWVHGYQPEPNRLCSAPALSHLASEVVTARRQEAAEPWAAGNRRVSA